MLNEIKVGNVVVIARGATALGTVTEAQAKRRMARGGKLNVNIDYVRLVDNEKAALRAVKETKGGGHTGAMTGAMVATGIVFFPAAPSEYNQDAARLSPWCNSHARGDKHS